MCFTYLQLAQVQWERAVETAEHAGCKPQSRSKHKKELLLARADTRGPSTVTDLGHWKCAQFCTRFNWCLNYLHVNVLFWLLTIASDRLSPACRKRKLQCNSRSITEGFRFDFLIRETLEIASLGSVANAKAFG